MITQTKDEHGSKSYFGARPEICPVKCLNVQHFGWSHLCLLPTTGAPHQAPKQRVRHRFTFVTIFVLPFLCQTVQDSKLPWGMHHNAYTALPDKKTSITASPVTHSHARYTLMEIAQRQHVCTLFLFCASEPFSFLHLLEKSRHRRVLNKNLACDSVYEPSLRLRINCRYLGICSCN